MNVFVVNVIGPVNPNTQRKGEARQQRVRQTDKKNETDSSAFSNQYLEHYINLYISKGLYEQQN